MLFSKQELKIIKLICAEYTTEEIAARLNRSPRTIEKRRGIIFKKMQVKGVIGLHKYAIQNRLIKGPKLIPKIPEE